MRFLRAAHLGMCFGVRDAIELDDAHILALEAHPRFGVAAQTTQSVEKVRQVHHVQIDTDIRRIA